MNHFSKLKLLTFKTGDQWLWTSTAGLISTAPWKCWRRVWMHPVFCVKGKNTWLLCNFVKQSRLWRAALILGCGDGVLKKYLHAQSKQGGRMQPEIVVQWQVCIHSLSNETNSGLMLKLHLKKTGRVKSQTIQIQYKSRFNNGLI